MSKGGARILVVDDEIEIVRALERSLAAHGFEVFTAGSGEEALEAISHHRPDVMLLDLGLPGMSGLEVIKRVRAQSNLPIIVLSVKDTEHDKVQAFDLGADDYVPKPFGMDEVLARLRAALRHSAQVESGTEAIFTAGPLRVDFVQRLVQVDGQEVKLTPTEYDRYGELVMEPSLITCMSTLVNCAGKSNPTRRIRASFLLFPELVTVSTPIIEKSSCCPCAFLTEAVELLWFHLFLV